MQSHGPLPTPGRWLLLASLLLAIGLGCWRCGDPWEDGTRGINGAAYTAGYVKSQLAWGLRVTRGGCVTGVQPFEPPVFEYGINHPPTYWLLQGLAASALGPSEALARLFSLLLFLPALPALYAIARRRMGELAAGAACLAFAGLPLVAYWGPMAVTDGPVLAAGLIAGLCFLRQAEAPARRRLWAYLCAVAWGGALDWQGYYAAPLCALLALADPSWRAGLRAALWGLLVQALVLCATLAHAAWVLGGPEALRQRLQRIVGASSDGAALLSLVPETVLEKGTPSEPGEALLPALARFAGSEIGPAALALAALGLVILLLRRDPRRWGRLTLCAWLAAPGLLHVLCFPAHARYHEFWILGAAPGLACLMAAPLASRAASAARSTADPGVRAGWLDTRVWRGLALLLLLACAVLGARTTLARIESRRTDAWREIGAQLNLRFSAGDVVCTNMPLAQACAYSRALLLWGLTTPAQLQEVVAMYVPPRWIGKRMAFVLPVTALDTPLGRLLEASYARKSLGPLLLYRIRG